MCYYMYSVRPVNLTNIVSLYFIEMISIDTGLDMDYLSSLNILRNCIFMAMIIVMQLLLHSTIAPIKGPTETIHHTSL